MSGSGIEPEPPTPTAKTAAPAISKLRLSRCVVVYHVLMVQRLLVPVSRNTCMAVAVGFLVTLAATYIYDGGPSHASDISLVERWE